MMQIDERIDYRRVQQFASQITSVSNRILSDLEQSFAGDQPDEFYCGLLAGMANSLAILKSEELSEQDKESLLGAMVAYVSDRIAKKGL